MLCCMRTTLTLDPDVAALLQRVRAASPDTLKSVVNEALRLGLARLDETPRPPRPFRTREASLGRPRLPDVDDVGEALALAEGHAFR
ncbi:hypothetical protein BH20ACT9_BH20ACT9_13940 [soil metagenome]